MLRALSLVALVVIPVVLADAPSGDVLVHAWLDADRDGAWQIGEPGVDAEILLSYNYLGPPYAVSMRTGDRGIAAAAGLVPGDYHVLVLAFDPRDGYIAPWFGYPGSMTVTAGETAIVAIPFWRWQIFVPAAMQEAMPPIWRPEMPPGLPEEWQGREETIGWYPDLERIEGLRCGRRLADCGAIE